MVCGTIEVDFDGSQEVNLKMADMLHPSTPARPDMDIREDITSLIVRYPPLSSERHLIEFSVEQGVVRFRGHIGNAINRGYLLEHTARVPGVRRIDAGLLFDQEAMRLDIGRVLPEGVMVNVRYSAVVLSGRPVSGEDIGLIAQQVANMPGVQKVIVA